MFRQVLVLGTIALGIAAAAWQAPGDGARAGVAELDAGGEYVVVRLRERDAMRLTEDNREAALTAVAAAQQRVLSSVAPGDFEVTYRYQLLPALVGTVSAEGRRVLEGHPDVAAVAADMQGHGGLLESVPMINANGVHALGYSGAGSVVAVLDSGVDTDHPDIADSLVHQECFMANPQLPSRCPNGTAYQQGAGAAEDDQGHGTNVTGIITSNGAVAPRGVAPGAQIAAFKVIGTSNTFWFSDLNAALDHILVSHPEIDLINMSLGSFDLFGPGSCEGNASLYNALRANGKLPFVASMNNGWKTGMAYPACVGSVISVGAVYDGNVGAFGSPACTDSSTFGDKVACWSNSDVSLDMLGPGCGTLSTGRFNSTSAYCGTSQATPHAVGVAALLLQATPSLTPAQIERSMESRAVGVLDSANGLTKPRVDALLPFDYDADGALNPGDPDDDNEGVPDSIEIPCGSDQLLATSVPERIDTAGNDDGDQSFNEPLPPGAGGVDCDGDGYRGSAEVNASTSDQDPCGASGWMSDLLPGGITANTLNVQDLGTFITPVRRFGTSPGHPDYDQRWDLSPGGTIGGRINLSDVAAPITGGSGYPRMFGGQRAFGRTCPFSP